MSAIDEDTVRTINAGRDTLGAMLSSAQANLQKVFIIFVIGFIGSFYALRLYIWDFLKATAKAEMSPNVADQATVITRTPFEVILLQAKIGMIVGVIVAIPALLYFSRDKLRERGVESVVPISTAYLATFVLFSLVLFVVGLIYAYAVFFPYAFGFLAGNAVAMGVNPSFGITEFTEFIALLTISFGLAAQLPLFMSALSYTEIVPYETFRDKWRHAIVAITVFGALFSPPDPFTLVMWAAPMVILYVFSLGLAKLVANIRRKGAAELESGTGLVKRRVLQFGLGILTIAGLSSLAISYGAFDSLEEEIYPALPARIRPGGGSILETLPAEHGLTGTIAAGLIVGLGVALVALIGYTIVVLQRPIYPRESALRTATDPSEIDLQVLEADAIERAPPQVFLKMTEEEAMEEAREAMYDDDKVKAQAILDRFDSLNADADADGATADANESATAPGESAGGESGDTDDTGDTDDSGGILSSTAAGMLDPFTEDETTEEDIGGYAYDFAFILNSLTSKMFRLVGLFMLVMGGTFFWLYQGGVGDVLELFLSRMPESVLEEVAVENDVDPSGMDLQTFLEQTDLVVAIHPVEVLIFAVKVSVIAGVVAVLPLLLYYAWPAARKRGLVRGDRRVFLVWGGTIALGFAAGTYLGFFWIAPSVISYLVADALANNMEVSYRIKSFFWLVIYTTVGIGFLFNIIVTMALFHVGGIVSYRTMLRRWRPVVVGIFTVAAFASPKGILTMFLMAIPLAVTYMLGLAVLYVLTGGGRLFGGGGSTSAPEPVEQETG
ncbi:twin-arginine translocase subunit TatC [Natronosalvus halobius]|uniref:twin-arginine translocase subunit TatC n=1 Tax=Natronosalvus halobius TaxID=2953746 RepID=UPI0020A1BAE7|nr:twin-arginine translocase subunit TatC [Natronosalvus halobius]USZ71048.1 twin-arginine translocase subunit TatC [Natronosalvus halobius]